MLAISSLSTEYVRVPVGATNAGVAVDPTADTVQLAFVAEGTTPATGDWKSGSWETDATTVPTTYYARALIGPAGVLTLTAGQTYDVFLKISDSPEVPVKKAGPVRAF